jgi:hypothetical protein
MRGKTFDCCLPSIVDVDVDVVTSFLPLIKVLLPNKYLDVTNKHSRWLSDLETQIDIILKIITSLWSQEMYIEGLSTTAVPNLFIDRAILKCKISRRSKFHERQNLNTNCIPFWVHCSVLKYFPILVGIWKSLSGQRNRSTEYFANLSFVWKLQNTFKVLLFISCNHCFPTVYSLFVSFSLGISIV